MTKHSQNPTCDYLINALPPQKPGQARMMTVCSGPDVDVTEVGHWFSPDAVREMLERAKQ